MGALQARVFGIILTFPIIFLSGFWLSHAGKLFGGVAGFIHKIISLAAVILLISLVAYAHHAARLSGIEWAVCVLAVLLFIAAMVSGGMVMADVFVQPARMAHRVAPYLVLLSSAAVIWLLRRSR